MELNYLKITIKRFFLIAFLTAVYSYPTLAREDDDNPVKYRYKISDSIRLGKQFEISVIFKIKEGWYIYAPTDINSAQGKVGTKVTFKLPAGIKTVGKIKLPDNNNELIGIYTGDNIIMSQKFEIANTMKTGEYSIIANLTYQSCNDNICFPPVVKEIIIPVRIK